MSNNSKKKKIDFNSFRLKTWITLISFAVVIIGLLWVSQVIFLNYYLNSYKLNEFREYVAELETDENDRFKYYNLASKSGCMIDILTKTEDGYTVKFTSNNMVFGERTYSISQNNIIDRAVEELNKDGEAFIKDSETSRYYYCIFLEDGDMLVLSQSTEMIDSTVRILRTQMIIVTITILVLMVCLSVIVSTMFTKDISKLSDSAKRLAESDYSVVFEEKGATEIAEIASTLNYATKEMAITTRLRRELMANVSHDIKTPLTIIKGNAEMIRDISGDNKEKREHQLDAIIKETDRLSILVKDMLELSRLETDPDLDKKVVSLSDIVSDIADSLSLYNEKEGYNITTAIQDGLFVYADRMRMQLATYNLISNAINYTGEDKTVEIKLEKVDNYARFTVRDTGEGISEENQKVIWDRYFRAKEHKRSASGNGLGLSIVKTILELHSARYGVDSVVGVGSTFWYEIELFESDNNGGTTCKPY